MKQVTLKAVLSATTLLAAASYGMTAQAHCIGLGSANFAANTSIVTASPNPLQYDKYIFRCPASVTVAGVVVNTTGANVRISKNGGTNGLPVTAEMSKDDGVAAGTSVITNDSNNAGFVGCNAAGGEAIGGGAGAIATLNGQGGIYEIMVSKDEGALPAAAGYAVEVHCLPAATNDVPSQLFAQGGAADVNRVANH